MDTKANDFNQAIIEEFRANEGRVGGRFQGFPLLLLHSVGAKTGASRINPLAYQQVGESFAVFGSKGGAPTHPDWYRNLVAHPDAEVEVGTRRIPVRARIARGAEREEIWSRQKQRAKAFAEYEKIANREIPVVLLEPRDA